MKRNSWLTWIDKTTIQSCSSYIEVITLLFFVYLLYFYFYLFYVYLHFYFLFIYCILFYLSLRQFSSKKR